MTPVRQGSFDTLGILTEPTDRDKRKVAMVEDSFRRLEQQPPRKKKRPSDGSTNPTANPNPNPNTSPNPNPNSNPNPNPANPANPAPNKTKTRTAAPNGGVERRYVDAGTSRSKSGSPISAASPKMASNPFGPATSVSTDSAPAVSRQASVGPRPNYCDAGVQTDPVEGEWYSTPDQAPRPKRRIVSLSKRLLDNRHRLRLDEEEKRRQQERLPSAAAQGRCRFGCQ